MMARCNSSAAPGAAPAHAGNSGAAPLPPPAAAPAPAARGVVWVSVCAVLLLLLAPAVRAQPAAQPTAQPEGRWMDSSLPVDERVALLLKQMTLEEKQAQTIHSTAAFSPSLGKQFGRTSMGAIPSSTRGDAASIREQNSVQAYFLNNSRLRIPVTFHAETLHSGGGNGTIFPMPCLQGATWDLDLVGRVAGASPSRRSNPPTVAP